VPAALKKHVYEECQIARFVLDPENHINGTASASPSQREASPSLQSYNDIIHAQLTEGNLSSPDHPDNLYARRSLQKSKPFSTRNQNFLASTPIYISQLTMISESASAALERLILLHGGTNAAAAESENEFTASDLAVLEEIEEHWDGVFADGGPSEGALSPTPTLLDPDFEMATINDVVESDEPEWGSSRETLNSSGHYREMSTRP
jgi:hypothetical protein